MGAFPIDIWYPKLCELARSEAARIARRVHIDREDAEQIAIIHAWEVLREQWPKPWAFVRIVMRHHLTNIFVRAPMQAKRSAGAWHGSLTVIVDGDEIERLDMPSTYPWPDVDDAIAMRTIMDKVYAHKPTARADLIDNVRDQAWAHGAFTDAHTRTQSRQRDEIARRRFIARARRLLRKRYD